MPENKMYDEIEAELGNRIAYCEAQERHIRPDGVRNRCFHCYRTLTPPLEGLSQVQRGTRIYNDHKKGYEILERMAKERSGIN